METCPPHGQNEIPRRTRMKRVILVGLSVPVVRVDTGVENGESNCHDP